MRRPHAHPLATALTNRTRAIAVALALALTATACADGTADTTPTETPTPTPRSTATETDSEGEVDAAGLDRIAVPGGTEATRYDVTIALDEASGEADEETRRAPARAVFVGSMDRAGCPASDPRSPSMRVTKYPQSCLALEKDGARLLIDLGNLAFDAAGLEAFGTVDAVLYTHRHGDHCDPRSFDALREAGIPLYGNADVCALIGEGSTEIRDGQPLEVAGFRILPRDLPHVELVDGSAGPPNTGVVVDDRLFHPGDGVRLDGLQVDVLAVPIAGPSISVRDAYRFVESTRAGTVIPIHYDVYLENPELFARTAVKDLARVVVLGPGESTEL